MLASSTPHTLYTTLGVEIRHSGSPAAAHRSPAAAHRSPLPIEVGRPGSPAPWPGALARRPGSPAFSKPGVFGPAHRSPAHRSPAPAGHVLDDIEAGLGHGRHGHGHGQAIRRDPQLVAQLAVPIGELARVAAAAPRPRGHTSKGATSDRNPNRTKGQRVPRRGGSQYGCY